MQSDRLVSILNRQKLISIETESELSLRSHSDQVITQHKSISYQIPKKYLISLQKSIEMPNKVEIFFANPINNSAIKRNGFFRIA